MRSLLSVLSLVLFLATPASQAAEPFLLKSKDVVLFLGDSNTFSGGYVAQIDAVLRTRRPDEMYTLINLGLPSETCTGLTEKDHPFPRPDVHERAERALTTIKPTVVFICYGMNDGIYHPFSEERFKAYQAGINKLVEKVRAANARPILITPPPFDAVPVKKQTRPADADDFSYKAPFEGYDGVLRRYSDWLLTLKKGDLPVIDAHQAVNAYLQERRKSDPTYTLARDGIHPNTEGHTVIAKAVLQGLNFPAEAQVVTVSPKEAVTVEVSLPLVPSANGPSLAPFASTMLKADLPAGESFDVLANGQVVATLSGADLARGVDIGTFPKLAAVSKGRQYLASVVKLHGTLDLALLTAIGHKRPQTPMGVGLDLARNQAGIIEKTLPDLGKKIRIGFEVRKAEAKPSPQPMAHRGLFKHAPENTLAAFGACLDLNLGFEFDVRRSKDGQLVILHDTTLDRTTNGTGLVSDMPLEAIRKLDAGTWFDPAFAGVTVPTLDTVVALLAERKHTRASVAVDMKVSDETVAQEVVTALEKHQLLDRAIFIGNTIESPELRRQLKQASPRAATARLVPAPENLPEALDDTTADWIYLRWLPTAEQVNSIHARNRRIFVAGVRVAGQEPENWRQLAQVGVDVILTDYPLEIRQTLRVGGVKSAESK